MAALGYIVPILTMSENSSMLCDGQFYLRVIFHPGLTIDKVPAIMPSKMGVTVHSM